MSKTDSNTMNSHQVPFTRQERYSPALGQQVTTYRSIFRDHITTNKSFKRQQRSIHEVAPPTLLALELYIYLVTYTPLTHDDVCPIIHLIMREVDWEMLAMIDEARDLRVPNIYDEEDNVEEEDMWTRIRGLPDDRITDSFNGLMERLDAMGLSVTGVLRTQIGRRTWVVVWEGRGLPVEKQPALVNSRFDIDPAAIIDESESSFDPTLRIAHAPGRVGFLVDFTGKSAPKLVSLDFMEVYDPDMGDDDHGNYGASDESDEELTRVLELSRKEF